jgi:hypothetical protein
MERSLVARCGVPAADVEIVFAKASILWRMAAFKAQNLGAAAICAAPACVGLAAGVLRVASDVDRQAAASGVSAAEYVKARGQLGRLLGVRLNLSAAELVRAAGADASLERQVERLVGAYRARDPHAAARLDPDTLAGAALLAAGAKARCGVDKRAVALATGATVPVLQGVCSQLRAALAELVGLADADGKAAERKRKAAGEAIRGHELDLEAAEACPHLADSGLVKKRREYEDWRARVVGGGSALAPAAAPAPAPRPATGAPMAGSSASTARPAKGIAAFFKPAAPRAAAGTGSEAAVIC